LPPWATVNRADEKKRRRGDAHRFPKAPHRPPPHRRFYRFRLSDRDFLAAPIADYATARGAAIVSSAAIGAGSIWTTCRGSRI
jgi:hypothetical protein